MQVPLSYQSIHYIFYLFSVKINVYHSSYMVFENIIVTVVCNGQFSDSAVTYSTIPLLQKHYIAFLSSTAMSTTYMGVYLI